MTYKWKKKRKGVPKNYKHIWRYQGVWRETKLGKGKGWKINFTATKGRKHRGMGSFGVGTTGSWRINGIQYIKKISRDKYQTRLIGRKYPIKFNVVKPRRRY
jgi:hypothetical protein